MSEGCQESVSDYGMFQELKPKPDPIYVCKCLLDDDESSEKVPISIRKQKIFSTVSRTENYLRDRRIPELIRYLLTKIIAHSPTKPILFLEKILDDCMLFRAGHGLPPVLYEQRHLEAVVKSFDPGQRGWLTIGQLRRLYTTLGLNITEAVDERVPTDIVLKRLKVDQEMELYLLLSAGIETDDNSTNNTESNSDKS